MIRESFLPHLFFGNTKTLSPIVGTLSKMPIKVAGIGLLNPVMLTKEKYLSPQRGSAELISAVTGGGSFSNSGHLWTLRGEICDGKKDREAMNKTKLKGLVHYLKGTYRRLILQAKITDACPRIRSSSVLGTVLSATEYRDFLCTCYNIYPLNLQSYCGGYVNAFGLTHALSCIIGGIVVVRPNQICETFLVSIPTCLHLIICMRQTPNTSRPYQIRARDTSGQ